MQGRSFNTSLALVNTQTTTFAQLPISFFSPIAVSPLGFQINPSPWIPLIGKIPRKISDASFAVAAAVGCREVR
jgi:hypothetical protein